MGFTIPELSSGRESFSPDASFYSVPFPADAMRFIAGPPTFAVEVRSESDYGKAAEEEMAAKRSDYFEAGTPVVWDVDPIAACVNVYRADAPEHPVTFRRGQVADAEPAVPGCACPWTAFSPEGTLLDLTGRNITLGSGMLPQSLRSKIRERATGGS